MNLQMLIKDVRSASGVDGSMGEFIGGRSVAAT